MDHNDEEFEIELSIEPHAIDAGDYFTSLIMKKWPEVTVEAADPVWPWRPAWTVHVPPQTPLSEIEAFLAPLIDRLFWDNMTLVAITLVQDEDDSNIHE